MKLSKPLYLSCRESFSKDFYQPCSPVVAAPVVTVEIGSAEDLSLLRSATPPQNAMLFVDPDLNITDRNGHPLASLYEALLLCSRTVPILCISSDETAEPLAAFLDYHRIADAMLCAAFRNRAILKRAYEKMSVLRCVMDCRGEQLPEELAALSGKLVAYGATSVILDPEVCTRENVHALQKRFIHVTCADTRGIFETIASGVNGMITARPADCYAAFLRFPENSFLRMRNLYAHKGFQNNGMFSENTITGVRAAAEYGFDGAEIDIKLTGDNVPIVMHNLNTRGLFDCEEKVIEKASYEELKPLRRIKFPEEGVDLFADLMERMKDCADTPVLIEFKPHVIYHKLEEMVAQVSEILKRPDVQKNCIGIMGAQEPGLGYVHAHLPELPLCHCESVPLAAPQNRAEAEERLYRLAFLTAGWAASYNAEDVMLNRTFNEYAKMRGMTVFPWSRSWTLAPSLWENNGRGCDATYLAGFDSWTTDHGDMYLYLPILLEAAPDAPTEYRVGEVFRPVGINRFRNRPDERAETELLVLEGELTEHPQGGYSAPHTGTVKVMLMQKLELHFGDHYYIFSEPLELNFR